MTNIFKHYILSPARIVGNKGGSVGYIDHLYKAFSKYNPTFEICNNIECLFLSPSTNSKNFILDEGLLSNGLTFELMSLIDFKSMSSIHCHDTKSFCQVYFTLKKLNLEKNVIKILTTHNPYRPSIEQIEIAKKKGIKNTNIFQKYENFAFQNADAFIFPSEDSLEGYFESWPEFKTIISDKIVKFCPTGLEFVHETCSSEILKKILNINPQDIVLIYIGRQSYARGSDIFLHYIPQILSIDPRIKIIAVGLEIKFKNDRIINIRNSKNVFNYINVADIALATNRASLFDLSMIEYVNADKKIVCPYVGGYKYLKCKYNNVFYYYSLNDLLKAIKDAISNKRNKADVQFQLTAQEFLTNYSKAISEIYEECSCGNNIVNNSLTIDKSEFLEVRDTVKLTSFQRKMRKLRRSPWLYFKDFALKKIKAI